MAAAGRAREVVDVFLAPFPSVSIGSTSTSVLAGKLDCAIGMHGAVHELVQAKIEQRALEVAIAPQRGEPSNVSTS
jgi:hypothetical protein